MAKLYFRYGTMGSGKSIDLLKVAYNYEERNQIICDKHRLGESMEELTSSFNLSLATFLDFFSSLLKKLNNPICSPTY